MKLWNAISCGVSHDFLLYNFEVDFVHFLLRLKNGHFERVNRFCRNVSAMIQGMLIHT